MAVPLARRNWKPRGRAGVGEVKTVNFPRRLAGKKGRETEGRLEGEAGIEVGLFKNRADCSY